MPWYFWLSVGITIGAYMNSEAGARHGYAAGKWTRALFIDEQPPGQRGEGGGE